MQSKNSAGWRFLENFQRSLFFWGGVFIFCEIIDCGTNRAKAMLMKTLLAEVLTCLNKCTSSLHRRDTIFSLWICEKYQCNSLQLSLHTHNVALERLLLSLFCEWTIYVFSQTSDWAMWLFTLGSYCAPSWFGVHLTVSWRLAYAVAQHSLWVACLPWFPLSRSVVLLSFFFCALSQSLHHIKSEGWALLCRWMLQENTPGVSHNQFPACLADFCREAFRLIGRHGAETPPSRHAVTLWFMGLFLSPFRFNGQYRQAAFSNIHSRSRATAPFCLPPRPFDRFPFPPARSPSIYAAMHDGVRMRTRQRANLLAAPEPSHQIRCWPFTFP